MIAKKRKVPISWEALEDAFENNAPEVHSYLHTENGEVIRIVDGVADPDTHARIMSDPAYLTIHAVSSREQYRWMERFIDTVEDPDLKRRLASAIDGRGAFRRFKDALMNDALERERWFTFRSERLRACIETWLEAHGIDPVERPEWRVPTAEEVAPQVAQHKEGEARGPHSRAVVAEVQRKRLHEVIDLLPARELDAALAFMEFLRERRPLPRPGARPPAEAPGAAPPGTTVEHVEEGTES